MLQYGIRSQRRFFVEGDELTEVILAVDVEMKEDQDIDIHPAQL